MANYTIIGDPHAKPGNLDKIHMLFDIIEELGNSCIMLGDLLDTKEVVRGSVSNAYYDRMANSEINFILLVGNHDWFNLQCQDHSLRILGELPNVRVIDKVQIGNLDGREVLFMPYIHDPDVMRELLQKYTRSTVFCHPDIDSFDFGNGRISQCSITQEDFKDFETVIAGHYHKYQQRGNITYLGTPFSHSFGETNQPKYIGIYNSESDEIELLNSPFPRHMTYEVDAENMDLEALCMNPDDSNRVILTGPKDLVETIQIEDVKIIPRYTENVGKSVVSEAQSPQQQFYNWATKIKGLDAKTVKLGLELLDV